MINDNQSLAQHIIAEDLKVQKLIEEAILVGGIYTMGYEKCFVLTNDLWKHKAGGIPKHCFLIATAMQFGEVPTAPEDEEIILLRVVGPAPLPAESELVAVRAEAMREIVTRQGMDAASADSAIIDVLTRNEIQFSAVEAKILGTFYEVEIEGKPLLSFGSDIETFYSASRYKVYKPYGHSLSMIASYPEVTGQEVEKGIKPARVRIGTVRYTSSTSRRRHNRIENIDTAVSVCLNIEDFVAMKTAVFGMTRMGKSNTMKTLATAIFQHAKETEQNIGQLLFDPAGEYANVNIQDKTALAQIGTDYVTIFRFGAAGEGESIRPLTTNFFNDDTIDVAWSIIKAYLSYRDADYIKSFLSADVIGPEEPKSNWSSWKRARRRRAALYATLLRAGFEPPRNFTASFSANKNVIAAVNRVLDEEEIESNSRGNLQLRDKQLLNWMEALLKASQSGDFPDDWIDSEMDAVLTVFSGAVGSGFKILEPIRAFHSPYSTRDYAEEVLEELIAGKIVIIDLSLGSENVLRFISERIINYILSDAARRFSSGESLHNLQIYLEEAHRLFNRDRFQAPEAFDPYVRLAKEAAKFHIGLVYATQEVTSVDPIVLSNTSNWVVTHLNNKIEVRELSKYYDFEDYAELALRAEDVGFARIKARSGRYIVPTQIDLFSEGRVQLARQAVAAAKNH